MSESVAEDYREGHPWGGRTKYECAHCSWDTLEERAMQAHVADFHPHFRCTVCGYESREGNQIKDHVAECHTQDAAPERLVTLTDKSGRPIH